MPFIEALRQLSFSLGIAGLSISIPHFMVAALFLLQLTLTERELSALGTPFLHSYETCIVSHGLFFLSISLGTVGPID